VLVKALFNLLGWLTQSTHDKLYRKQLDALYDELDRGSFYEFFVRLQQRFVSLIGDTCFSSLTGKVRLVWYMLLSNIIALVISAEAFELIASDYPNYVAPVELATRIHLPDYYPFKGIQVLLFPGWAPYGKIEPIMTFALRLLGGVMLCVVSLCLAMGYSETVPGLVTFMGSHWGCC